MILYLLLFNWTALFLLPAMLFVLRRWKLNPVVVIFISGMAGFILYGDFHKWLCNPIPILWKNLGKMVMVFSVQKIVFLCSTGLQDVFLCR